MEKITRIRDSVHDAPVGIIINAQSESITAAGRMEKGRRINVRAAQLEATHCLMVGEVVYFADTGGVSLAAQFEKGAGGLPKIDQPRQVCVPLDEMVYLCRYADGLVSGERCLVPDRARQELQNSDLPVLVFPAGRLGKSFEDCGEAAPTSALRLRGFRNPYLFRSTLACLLYHGIPVSQHGTRAALALAVLVAVSAAAVRLYDGGAPLPEQVVLPTMPEALPVAAPGQLRAFSQAVHHLVPVASWLGLQEVRLQGEHLVLTGSPGSADPSGDSARHLGFQQVHWDTGRFEWRTPLVTTTASLVALPSPTAAEAFIGDLRHAVGIQVMGIYRRNTAVETAVELELRIGRKAAYAIEHLAALVGALPSSLRAMRLQYGERGLPTGALLELVVRTHRS